VPSLQYVDFDHILSELTVGMQITNIKQRLPVHNMSAYT